MNQPHASEIPLVLMALGGPLNQQSWTIENELVLGRDPRCDVVIPNRQISRRHARVFRQGEGIWVEDLGSKNGTFINGERVEPGHPVQLQEGDTLVLALAQRFVLRAAPETQTLPLPPEEWQGEEAQEIAELQPPAETQPAQEPALTFHRRLEMDLDAHRVWILGREVDPPLSRLQFRLLATLYQRAGEVIPRVELAEAIWGKDSLWVTQPALDALLHRLRERLAEYDPDHTYIVTVRGQGIRLDNPDWTPEEPVA